MRFSLAALNKKGFGQEAEMEKEQERRIIAVKDSFWRFVLPILLSAVLATGGFSCNLLTGPHNSTGPDTTSSNFTWTVDTIGGPGSILYDCSVVNDTLAYAVGLIMPSDSVGRNNTIYWDNAVVWNGVKWKPFQVPYYYNGQKTFTTITFMFARNPDDIWYGFAHWDGKQYSEHLPGAWFNSQANKMWESANGNQIYIIGNNGLIAYSSDGGNTWQQVETGTTLPFQDIWGDGGQVLAVASDKFGLGGKYLVELNGNTAVHLDDSIPTAVSLSGVWFKANQKYFLVGDGIYESLGIGQKVWHYDTVSARLKYYTFAVRGNSINDVFTCGDAGTLAHWNGDDWTAYPGIQNTADGLRSVSFKRNAVVAVGERYLSGVQYYGVVYTGRR